MLTISKIKHILTKLLGTRVKVFYYGGRNKKERFCGIICGVYKNIFTIKLDNGNVKSFSYSDVLIKTVKICY